MTPYHLRPSIAQAIVDDARRAYEAGGRESCGLIVRVPGSGDAYRPCRNLASHEAGQERFILDPAAWAAAEDEGEIVAVVHSHPDAPAHPSDADRVMCERTGLPWLIVSMPSGVILQTLPTGQPLPLVGRQFHHGVVDCYTLIQDHYAIELGITLPHFERADDWWAKGQDLYRDGFAQAGFVEVGPPTGTTLRPHDVVLMCIRAQVENHGGVILEGGHLLHHLWGRLSSRDVWGGYWARHTTTVLRHRQLLGLAEAA